MQLRCHHRKVLMFLFIIIYNQDSILTVFLLLMFIFRKQLAALWRSMRGKELAEED